MEGYRKGKDYKYEYSNEGNERLVDHCLTKGSAALINKRTSKIDLTVTPLNSGI
jgi:hypothetical protein